MFGLFSISSLATTLISFLVFINVTIATWLSLLLSYVTNIPYLNFLPRDEDMPKTARPRVAVIGGGDHGVNTSSCLQFQALFYRFHPIVKFGTAFPKRDEIVHELKRIWRTYDLVRRTRFNTLVKSVKPLPDNTWSVDGEIFDGVIVAVGTCGEEMTPEFKGIENFKGFKIHSSKLDDLDLPDPAPEKGFKIVVFGSGASAVEVVDYVLEKVDWAERELGPGKIEITIVARHDKWIIPRGIIVDAIASMLPPALGFLMERFLRVFWYGRDLKGMTPTKPFAASTPCLNTRYLSLIRNGQVRYIRGSIDTLSTDSVRITNVEWDSRTDLNKPGVAAEQGKTVDVKADGVVFATGFRKPELKFVSKEVWGGEFEPPNLHMVAFPPRYPTLMFLND
ncbi:hypothetical protein HK104_005394, partial [Borealophlyctis nickersoniae]